MCIMNFLFVTVLHGKRNVRARRGSKTIARKVFRLTHSFHGCYNCERLKKKNLIILLTVNTFVK
ncbi:hypothetical protein PUN28_016524 [Cardiocondyla obscurior]|uniref:Ribosomal protein L20 n=1 Tax=Cardiocondyla obscurior TaxID=286306 RepID=A0AAW2EMH8_9HYME